MSTATLSHSVQDQAVLSSQRAILEDNYLEVQRLIYDTCHRFIRSVMMRKIYLTGSKYQDVFEEVLSVANLHFMEAEKKYDADKASFPTWICYSIHHRLLDWWDVTARYMDRYNHELDEGNCGKENRTNLSDVIEGLSEDARFVVNMILEDNTKPQEWSWLWAGKEWKESIGLPDNRHSARKCIKQRLVDLGWPPKYITTIWNEVAEAISGVVA